MARVHGVSSATLRSACHALVAALLAGCVHDNVLYHNARSEAIANVSTGVGKEPRAQHNMWMMGLAIDFPAPTGWLVRVWEPSKFLASRVNAAPLHTSLIMAFQLPAPPGAPFASDEAFIRFARADRESDREREIRRLEFDGQPGSGQWKGCLRYYKRFETRDEKNAPGRPLLYEETGYVCRHPQNSNVYLRVDYSERYPADAPAQEFRDRAAKVLNDVYFTAHYTAPTK